jgi:hypothetical protein
VSVRFDGGYMAEIVPFLIIGLIAAIVIVVGWFQWKLERERTDAIGRVAARLGWSFDGAGKDRNFDERYGQFSRFQQGHSRFAHNQSTGSLDGLGRSLNAEAGDYHYQITSGSGKNRSTTTYRFSYLLVTLPYGTRTPAVALRTENLWDKFVGGIGFEDIDFESAEFSRRYHVSGTDRRFAYDLLHPRMIDWMLKDTPPCFEISGGVLLVVSNGGVKRWEPQDFGAAVDWTLTFFSHWPDYLVRDLGAR